MWHMHWLLEYIIFFSINFHTWEAVENATFFFSPYGQNAMLLLPQQNANVSRPRYYITVSMNCFFPFSYITTIYRGTSPEAPRVGEFEWVQLMFLALAELSLKRKGRMGILAGAPSERQIGEYPAEILSEVLKKSSDSESVCTHPHPQALSLNWQAREVSI